MIESIAAFVKTGNPNAPALGIKWENYPSKIIFDASPTQLKTDVE